MGLTVEFLLPSTCMLKSICQYLKKNSPGILIEIVLNIDDFGENRHCISIRKGLPSDIGNFGK